MIIDSAKRTIHPSSFTLAESCSNCRRRRGVYVKCKEQPGLINSSSSSPPPPFGPTASFSYNERTRAVLRVRLKREAGFVAGNRE